MKIEKNKGLLKSVYIIVPIILLNLVIKGLFIAQNPLYDDEPFSVYFAQMDIASIIRHLSSGNNPPLYELFLHGWIKIFGISELSVRIPSLIFSCITVFFIFRIGLFIEKKVAVLAALLFVFSNYQVVYAHEARVYALFGMLSAAAMFFFISLTRKENLKFTSYLWLFFANVLLIYAHYFGFFILIVQFLSVVFIREFRIKFWKPLLIFTGFILIAYIPNMIVLFDRFTVSTANGTWVEPPNGIVSLYNMLWKFSNAPVVTVTAIALLLTGFVKYLLRRRIEKISIDKKIILIWFLFPFFFMFFISYSIPMFFDRYLMFVSIAFYFVLSIASLYIIKRKFFNLILPIAICIMFIVTVKPNNSIDGNLKKTVEKIKEMRKDNTLVLFCPHNFILNFVYYYDVALFRNVDNENVYDRADKELKKQNVIGINHFSDITIKDQNHIIYFDAAADFSFPDNNILNTLSREYDLKNKITPEKGFKLYEFFHK